MVKVFMGSLSAASAPKESSPVTMRRAAGWRGAPRARKAGEPLIQQLSTRLRSASLADAMVWSGELRCSSMTGQVAVQGAWKPTLEFWVTERRRRMRRRGVAAQIRSGTDAYLLGGFSRYGAELEQEQSRTNTRASAFGFPAFRISGFPDSSRFSVFAPARFGGSDAGARRRREKKKKVAKAAATPNAAATQGNGSATKKNSGWNGLLKAGNPSKLGASKHLFVHRIQMTLHVTWVFRWKGVVQPI
eukprot:scaffold1850_cov194-Pinguiococcus_pyrenoidosus.AAC.52